MGFLYAFLASIFVNARDIVSKKLALQVDSKISTYATYLYALLIYIPIIILSYVIFGYVPIISVRLFVFVLLRNFSDIFTEYFKLKAFETGDFSIITSILATSPFFTFLLSLLTLKEKLSVSAISAILLIILGNIIIVKASVTIQKNKKAIRLAIIFALISACLGGLNNIFDKLAVKESNPITTSMMLSAVAFLLLTPLIFLFQKRKISSILTNSRPFSLRAVFEVGYTISKITALSFLNASVVDAIKKSSILLNVISGRIFFKEKNSSIRILGAFSIFLGLLILLFAK